MNPQELRAAVLELLCASGPMSFDEITESLGEADSRIGMALGYLEAQALVESNETTQYKWGATKNS